MKDSGWRIPDSIGALRCIALQWPEGRQWDTMLTGMLFTLTRGRQWDKTTGIIKTGQAYGWTIWDANYPLVACGGDGDGDTPQDSLIETRIVYVGGGAGDSEEAEMGQVVTNVEQVSPGILRIYFGHCCYEDIIIGSGGIEVDDGALDDVVGDGLPFAAYSACAKAAAIVEITIAVGQAIWDNRAYPWLWVKKAQDAAGVNLNDTYVLAAGTTAANIALLEGITDTNIFDTVKWAKVQCKLESILDADGTGIDSSDFDAFKSFIVGEFGTIETFLLLGNFWATIANAFGVADYSDIAKLAAVRVGDDCACPSEYVNPWPAVATASGWYVGEPFFSWSATLTNETFEVYGYGQQAHDVFGLVIDSFHGQAPWDGAGTLKRMDSLGLYPGYGPMFANSSDHLEDSGIGKWSFIDETAYPGAANELGAQFKAGAKVLGTVANPLYLGGGTSCFRFTVWSGDNLTRAYNFDRVRYIHNINSPSHSA